MKSKILIWTLIAAAVAAAGFFFVYRYCGDEAQVRRQIAALCGEVRKTRGESPAAGMFKAAALEKFFAAEIELSCDTPRIERKIALAEVKTLFIQLRRTCDAFTVDCEIVAITLTGPRATAEINLCVSGFARGEAEKFTGLRSGKLELEKSGGKWKIVRCSLSSPLQ